MSIQNPQIQALQQALAGQIPNPQMAGGAPPAATDYAGMDFDKARQALSALANKLHQNRDEHDANRVVKLLTQLSDIALERRKKAAQVSADSAAGQLSPMAAMGSMGARGMTRGY